MGFWKALLGGKDQTPEEERQEKEQKNFDLLKYDGVKAMKIGQLDYAVRCFQEALKLTDDLEVHDYLSQVLVRQGALDEALSEVQLLADAEPGNLSVLLRKAQIAYMMEDYETMGDACQQALEIAPDSAQVHFFYAQAYIGKGNGVGAIAMLTKAVTLQEDYGEAYLLRGQTLLKMGDTKGAAADAAWLLENIGNHEDVLLFNARVAVAHQQTEEALAFYNKVIDVNPFSIEAYYERGQLRLSQGDKSGADEDMRKLLELNPNALADVSGEYSAEGIEQRVRQAYSAVNPLGL